MGGCAADGGVACDRGAARPAWEAPAGLGGVDRRARRVGTTAATSPEPDPGAAAGSARWRVSYSASGSAPWERSHS
ncbi:hypothetical protein ATKI12_4195 [Kitasatospora sp. Ki12]